MMKNKHNHEDCMNIYVRYVVYGALVLYVHVLYTMEKAIKEEAVLRAPHTYHGTAICKEKLHEVLLSLPPDKEAVVQQWKERNKLFLKQLMHIYYPNSACNRDHVLAKETLREYGVENLGRNNYVFILPDDPQLVVQIAGKIHRQCSIRASYYGKGAQEASAQELDALDKVQTYLTVSRYTHGLLLQELLEEIGDTYLYFPRTYLVPLYEGVQQYLLTDDTAFVVQEKYTGNPQRLATHPHLMLHMETPALHTVALAIQRAGLWNIQNQLMINENDQFVLANVQQEDSARPQWFFHKKNKEYEMNITEGFKELFYICACSEQRRYVQQYVQEEIVPYMRYEKKHLLSCLAISPGDVA